MYENKIKNFDGFKSFINNILAKNKKNKGFLVEVKNILCENDYYSNNKNIKTINKINYKQNNNFKNKINKVVNNSDNSSDIKFTQNDDNFKIMNDYNNTYY